jgi:hypothetical protein
VFKQAVFLKSKFKVLTVPTQSLLCPKQLLAVVLWAACYKKQLYMNFRYPDDISKENIWNKNISDKDISNILIYQKLG